MEHNERGEVKMAKVKSREELRKIKHKRVRKKVFGYPERPRLAVFKSSRYIYAQIIDDVKGQTLCYVSSKDKDIASNFEGKYSLKNIEVAKMVGKKIAEKAKAKGINKVVFDRGGFVYHGKIKALADAAREAGLEF